MMKRFQEDDLVLVRIQDKSVLGRVHRVVEAWEPIIPIMRELHFELDLEFKSGQYRSPSRSHRSYIVLGNNGKLYWPRTPDISRVQD